MTDPRRPTTSKTKEESALVVLPVEVLDVTNAAAAVATAGGTVCIIVAGGHWRQQQFWSWALLLLLACCSLLLLLSFCMVVSLIMPGASRVVTAHHPPPSRAWWLRPHDTRTDVTPVSLYGGISFGPGCQHEPFETCWKAGEGSYCWTRSYATREHPSNPSKQCSCRPNGGAWRSHSAKDLHPNHQCGGACQDITWH